MAILRPAMTWSKGRAYAWISVCLLIAGTTTYFALARGRSGPLPHPTVNVPDPTAIDAAVQHLQVADQIHRTTGRIQPLLEKLKQTPNDSALLAEIGDGYYQARDFPQAAEYYKRSLTVKDDPAVRIKLGGVYFYSGDADRAIAEFQRILKTDPGNANALFNLGLTRWQAKGDGEGAIRAWRQLIKLNPNHPRRAEVEQMIMLVKQHAAAAMPAQGPSL